ncbi:MAG: DUF4870 domain-containing protein [Candidatus Pacearchaeota archaeon]
MAYKGKGNADEDKIFAFLCYLISIIGVILVLATKSERSQFSIYHAKQGLVLFIAWIITWIVGLILAVIPIVGWVISMILWICMLLLWIVGMINALTGKQVPLPVIGSFGEKFKF